MGRKKQSRKLKSANKVIKKLMPYKKMVDNIKIVLEACEAAEKLKKTIADNIMIKDNNEFVVPVSEGERILNTDELSEMLTNHKIERAE